MSGRVNKNSPARNGSNTRNCANLIYDRRGSTALEFGLIAMPFFLLVLGILEYAYGNYVQARLDAVVMQTSRQIMTGYVQQQTSGGKPLTAQQFHDDIMCPKLPALMKCADLYVDVSDFDAPPDVSSASPYENYVNTSKTGLKTPALDNTRNSYCLGAGKKYVVLRVAYAARQLTTPLIGIATTDYKGHKVRVVTSTATFKNEPFPTSNAGC